jgi:hypothetical protein
MTSFALHIPVAIILLGGGVLACFLGYHLLRTLLAVYGFVGGVIIATIFVERFEEIWMSVLVLISGGLVGSILALVAYIAGIALLGAAFGAVALNIAWSYQKSGDPEVWLVIIACLISALVALFLRRYVIIIGTSFGGALIALVGILALAGNSFAISVINGNVQQLYPLILANDQKWFTTGWFGLGVLSVLIQLRGIKKRNLSKKTH